MSKKKDVAPEIQEDAEPKTEEVLAVLDNKEEEKSQDPADEPEKEKVSSKKDNEEVVTPKEDESSKKDNEEVVTPKEDESSKKGNEEVVISKEDEDPTEPANVPEPGTGEEAVEPKGPSDEGVVTEGSVASEGAPASEQLPEKVEEEPSKNGSDVPAKDEKVEKKSKDPSSKIEKGSVDGKEKKPDEAKAEKAPAVKIEFPPIPEDGSELLKDIPLPSRKGMVDKLVNKHNEFVTRFKEEMASLEKPPEEIIGESVEEKTKRDSINKEVADLKDKRTSLKESNKDLRSRFFELLKKEETLKEHEKEVQIHQSFIEDLEWKMATEAIDIQTERRLLDELKGTMRKIRGITDGLTPEEIKVQLSQIEETIGENLISIEELHTKMLEKVEESNVHHEKYLGAQRKVKEKESRKGWLDRRIKLHTEMAIFWEGQKDQANQMDNEESKRGLETIRENLMKIFGERDSSERVHDNKVNEGQDRERRTKKSGPRRKLEIRNDSRSKPSSVKDGESGKEAEKKEEKDVKIDTPDPKGDPEPPVEKTHNGKGEVS